MRARGIAGTMRLSVFLLAAVALICTSPIAQAQTPPERAVDIERDSRPEVARFRAQLVDFSGAMELALQQYLEVNASVVSDDPYYQMHIEMIQKARNAFVRARHILPAASDNDIERMKEAFALIPQLTSSTKSYGTTTGHDLRMRRHRGPLSAWPKLDTSGICNGDQYSATSSGAEAVIGLDFGWVSGMISDFLELFTVEHNDVDPWDGEISTPDFTAYDRGLTGASQCTEAQSLLDLIYELIPDTIGDVSVGFSLVVEFSVGKDIPNPLKAGFAIFSSVNKLICVRMDLANALGDDCNLNASFDIIDIKIEAISSDIAALDDRLEKHDIKMTAEHLVMTDLINTRADAIDDALRRQLEFLEQFRGLSVRLAIEKNLLDDGNDVISLFELPAGTSPPGGMDGTGIELVREIVYRAIENCRAAGLPVYTAEDEFARGDTALAEGDYRAAFANYRKAYISAVK